MENKIKGAIYGYVLGDIIGMPYEAYRRMLLKRSPAKPFKKKGTHQKEAGTFSDETSLLLATMDSISKNNSIDFEDLMKSYTDWLFNGAYNIEDAAFGIRETIFNCVNKYKNGLDISFCGDDFEENSDVSAIIRMLPICLHLYKEYGKEFYNDDDALFYLFGSIELTNKQDTNLIANIYYSVLISNLLDGKDIKESILSANEFLEQEFSEEDCYAEFEKILNPELLEHENLKSDDNVVNLLECVIYGLLNTDNYEDLIMTLVNLGGQTDSIAAIGGSLAGIYYGYNGIPKEWIEQIRNIEYISNYEEKFSSNILN